MGRSTFQGPLKIKGDLEIASSTVATNSEAAGTIVITENSTASFSSIDAVGYVSISGANNFTHRGSVIVDSGSDLGWDSVGGHIVQVVFKDDKCSKNSSETLQRADQHTGTDRGALTWLAPRAGSVVAITAQLEGAYVVDQETISFHILQTGSNVTPSNTGDHLSPSRAYDAAIVSTAIASYVAGSYSCYHTYTKGSMTFAAGDWIGVKRSSTANMSYSGDTTAGALVTLYMEI